MSAILHVAGEDLRDFAESQGVCVRPILHEVSDSETGRIHLVPTPCGARRASKCKPCADKARRLRMQQCREGWHMEEEPERPEKKAQDGQDKSVVDRRTRTTRRRHDAPDLPRLPIEDRTVGRAFTGRSGQVYRPSMFLTFTLPSYGRVRADGTPVNPAEYDYRRAALDALHFSKLVDRVWQNIRRAVGFKVQYFAAVEPQRRLAPHLHAAVRGAVPREALRQVIDATYHQVWWPPCDEPMYIEQLPVWRDGVGYVDPDTGTLLPSWSEALDAFDADSSAPTHVMRFGRQMDVQGILATEGDADRRVAYLTKYLSKSFSDAYATQDDRSRRQRAHLHRLHHEVRWLPCSPRCWNWLRFGVQPQSASKGMVPGSCPSKAHDTEHLGCGGRRVLVSRLWTGKTLKDHKADRAEVVRQVLLAAGIEKPEVDRLSVLAKREDGAQRFHWTVHDPMDSTVPLYRQVMTAAIHERMRWRAEYDVAQARAGPVATLARPPDIQPSSAGGASVKGERSESRSDTKCP